MESYHNFKKDLTYKEYVRSTIESQLILSNQEEEIVEKFKEFFKFIYKEIDSANIQNRSKFIVKHVIIHHDSDKIKQILEILKPLGMKIKINAYHKELFVKVDIKDYEYEVNKIKDLDQKINSVMQDRKVNENSRKRICASVKCILSNAHQYGEICSNLKNKDIDLFKEVMSRFDDLITIRDVRILTEHEVCVKGKIQQPIET